MPRNKGSNPHAGQQVASKPKSAQAVRREVVQPSDQPYQTMSGALTENEHAVTEYLWSLAHPEDGPITGVPLPIGGYTPDSTTINLTTEGSFGVDDAGRSTLLVYGSAGAAVVEAAGIVPDALKRIPINSMQQFMGIYTIAGVANGPPPTYGTSTTASGRWAQITLPLAGIELYDSEARLVSASLEVFCDTAALTRQGTGMMVTPGVWSQDTSCNNVYEAVYAQPRNHRAVGNLADEHVVFRAEYVPMRQEQLFWADSATSTGSPTVVAGLPIFGFYALNCASLQTFRYTIVWNFEVNSSFVRATSSNMVASSGMEVVHHAGREIVPTISIATPSAGSVMTGGKKGPRVRAAAERVAAVLGRLFSNVPAMVQKVGRGLTTAGKVVGPALLAAAPLILGAALKSGAKGPFKMGGRERNPLLL